MVKYSADAWRRFGDAVRRERAVLRMTQPQLALSMGLSVDTVAAIEGAKRPISRETRVRVEEFFKWTPGASDLILKGDTFVRRAPPPTTREGDTEQDLEDILQAFIDEFGPARVGKALTRVLKKRSTRD